ncbi:hypothetical protein GOV13_00475 [Candidatus Pacearchaeota archaeon]|nr:hypothetical protein [Candidatus Pacearchaeota archaeon]
MKRGIVLSLVVCLLLVSFVSAIDTEIKINTLSNHTLNLQFLNPTPPPISFLAMTNNSGETGEFSYVFSDDVETFILSVFLMKGSDVVLSERFENITAGKKVVLTFIPGVVEIDKDYQEIVLEEIEPLVENQTDLNATENQTGELTNDDVNGAENIAEQNASNESSEGFLRKVGFVFSEREGSFSMKNIYYGIGVILIFGILFFVFKKHKHKLEKGLKDLKEDVAESAEEETLEEAEEELEKMTDKVEKLKEEKDEKVKVVKQRLIDDEKELMELRAKKKKEEKKE